MTFRVAQCSKDIQAQLPSTTNRTHSRLVLHIINNNNNNSNNSLGQVGGSEILIKGQDKGSRILAICNSSITSSTMAAIPNIVRCTSRTTSQCIDIHMGLHRGVTLTRPIPAWRRILTHMYHTHSSSIRPITHTPCQLTSSRQWVTITEDTITPQTLPMPCNNLIGIVCSSRHTSRDRIRWHITDRPVTPLPPPTCLVSLLHSSRMHSFRSRRILTTATALTPQWGAPPHSHPHQSHQWCGLNPTRNHPRLPIQQVVQKLSRPQPNPHLERRGRVRL